MANIKLTELSELTQANNTNTIFYVADLSVSPNVSHYMRLGSFTSDNAIAYLAYSVANLAFARANTSLSVGWNANIAYNHANSAFAQANNGFNVANAAFNQANNSFNVANAAFGQANNSFNVANVIFLASNSAASFANGAFIQANNAASFANGAFTSANNLAVVNTTQNTNISSAQSFANGAFTAANTKVSKSGDIITGVITAPTAANGTSNTMIATTQFVRHTVDNALGYPIVRAYAVVSINSSVASLTRGFNVASVSRLATGRYQVTFTTPMSTSEYAISAVCSTYNMGAVGGSLNYDHIINIESTSTTSFIVNTGDARGNGNNQPHDVAKFWVTIFV